MAVSTKSPLKTKPSFPGSMIEQTLKDELVQAIQDIASVEAKVLPSTPAAIIAAAIHVDSLTVVEVLCIVDNLVGFELPDTVVRFGGYESIAEAIEHVMPKIEAEWRKRNGG